MCAASEALESDRSVCVCVYKKGNVVLPSIGWFLLSDLGENSRGQWHIQLSRVSLGVLLKRASRALLVWAEAQEALLKRIPGNSGTSQWKFNSAVLLSHPCPAPLGRQDSADPRVWLE